MPPINPPGVDILLSLSDDIAKQVHKYAEKMRDCEGSYQDLSSHHGQELQEQAEAITRACAKLQSLVSEPSQWVVQAAWSFYDSVAISLVLEMSIPTLVKSEGEAVTAEYLANCTGSSPSLIKRIMRQCINRFIFTEVEPERYRHNRHSLRLLDGNFGSLIHYLVDDGLLCGAHLTSTLSRNGFQILNSPREAAFCKAFQTDLPLYEYYHSVDTQRGQRFARAMAGHYDGPLDKPIELIFPFENVPPGSLLVDIGGGNGQQAIRLASLYPHLSCVVQDHDSVVSAAGKASNLTESVAARITWEAHNYYDPQPRKGAAIYLLSHVLMDNSDAKCVQMIQAVAEAMNPKESRLLIHDFVDLPRSDEDGCRLLDTLDLHMIASLNTHSRSEAEWDALIQSVPGRLARHKTWIGKDGSAVLEIRLEAI